VIVEKGLEEGDDVLLVPPLDGGTMEVERLDDSPVGDDATSSDGKAAEPTPTGSAPRA